MSVKVEGLTKTYGDQRAVDGISFEIKGGEVVGFLGPNGAGKSTTMRMLTGYLSPTAGRAWVGGRDVEEDSLEVRRRIGYLPEHNPLYTEMYVKEYLHFIAGIHGYRGSVKKRVQELVEITGLGVEQHKKIGALSKGYRQRVGLAQALLHDPEVLILDEPTSGLDPNQIVEIRSLIRNSGQQKTVILSTHIMQEVQAMCSRVIIISRGKIVADDATASLTGRVAGKSFLQVAFRNPAAAESLQKIEGVEKVALRDNLWVLQSASDRDIRDHVFQWAMQNNNPIYEMKYESQSLEEVFRELTKGNEINDQ